MISLHKVLISKMPPPTQRTSIISRPGSQMRWRECLFTSISDLSSQLCCFPVFTWLLIVRSLFIQSLSSSPAVIPFLLSPFTHCLQRVICKLHNSYFAIHPEKKRLSKRLQICSDLLPMRILLLLLSLPDAYNHSSFSQVQPPFFWW